MELGELLTQQQNEKSTETSATATSNKGYSEIHTEEKPCENFIT